MSSNVNVYDAPPLRRAGVFDTTTTSGGDPLDRALVEIPVTL
jgi:hypothetical protein